MKHNLKNYPPIILTISSILITACSTVEVVSNKTHDGLNINDFTYTGDVLRKKSVETELTAPETHRVAQLLLDEAAKGDHAVGLAAPQLGINQRIFVFQIPKGIPEALRTEGVSFVPWTVAVNPQYFPASDSRKEMQEGCFSVPHFYSKKVPRYEKIHYEYYTLQGKKIEGTATGLFAQVFQHETDHLNGILYIDLVKDKNHLLLVNTLNKK